MNPLEFQGSLDPLKAYEWFSNMERLFQTMPCSKENNVTFASHMLKGHSARWWDSVSTLMTNQGITRDWEYFKTTFLDMYFPSILRTQKEFEFHKLKQGNMLVERYTEKIDNMAIYCR